MIPARRPVYGRGVNRNRRDGSMNGLEKRYAKLLDERKASGEIVEWAFEPVTFRIATTRATYTPDFRVMLPDGEIQFHEVKGGLFEAAAKLRIKVAADQHPHRFFVARAKLVRDGGGFDLEEV